MADARLRLLRGRTISIEPRPHPTDLTPAHAEDLARLCRSLAHGPPFQLWLAAYSDTPYRDSVIAHVGAALQANGLVSAVVALTTDATEIREVESLWRKAASHAQVLHVIGCQTWFDESLWRAFNLRREEIARNLGARLVLWLQPGQIAQVADWAPDWWAWRAGLVEFVPEPERIPANPGVLAGPIDSRPMAVRLKRAAVLRDWLQRDPPLEDDLRLPLLDELARLAEGFGQLDEALRIRLKDELPALERLGAVRGRAIAMGKVANLLQALGRFDEALAIHTTEELPVYQQLRDHRGLLGARTNLALSLSKRGCPTDRLEIAELLTQAHTAALAMRIPEAAQIANHYADIFGKPLP